MELYHFTSEENLKSIWERGLLAVPILEKSKISFIPSSNQTSRDLDRRKGLEKYVRLCKSRDHKMAKQVEFEGRVKKLVWLKVHPRVLDYPNTRFCNKNATTNGAEIEKDKYTFLNSMDDQAEVLIFQQVPIIDLVKISTWDPPTAVSFDEVPF